MDGKRTDAIAIIYFRIAGIRYHAGLHNVAATVLRVQSDVAGDRPAAVE